MKLSITPLSRCASTALVSFLLITCARAQSLTAIYHFGGTNGYLPQAAVVASGGALYGTTFFGGASDFGTIFKINMNGTGFTVLHNFNGTNGRWPRSTLLLVGNTLYGTARYGGTNDWGVVFRINTDGSNFAVLHSFTNGGGLKAGVTLVGDTLYGVTQSGGGPGTSGGPGTVYSVKTNGSGYTVLHAFTGADGADASGDLLFSGDMLYGTTYDGGNWGSGTVFKLRLDGGGFTNLYHLRYLAGEHQTFAGLILRGSVLYGTAISGTAANVGCVFAINTNGSGFRTVHRFQVYDGGEPKAPVLRRGNILYGSSSGGGTWGKGTIFAVREDGTGFTNLHHFSAMPNGYNTNSDGATPYSGLICVSNTLYGTTEFGGMYGGGTLFKITLPPPQLQINRSGGSVVLTWPADSGFNLERAASLSAHANWLPDDLEPVVIEGQNTVTDTSPEPQRFYRLRQ